MNLDREEEATGRERRFWASLDRTSAIGQPVGHSLDQLSLLAPKTYLFQFLSFLTLRQGNHPSLECQFGGLYEVNSSEQVNYMSNNQRQYNPNSNYFNQGWRNHPNFSRSNNTHVQKPPSGFQSQENKPNLEEFSPNLCKRLTILLMILKQVLGTKVQVFATLSIKRGISKLLTEITQGTLPSISETNPKKHVEAITLRSGKELEQSKEAEQQANKEDTSVPKEQVASTPIQPSTPKPSSNAISFP
ncbi:hypothetical protein VitviT2T_008580 [Vitis vinifera]|uniref:Peroxin-14 n=1 Tax=Vitis vinifera TaxID=29760 RepID=A0ABY9C2Z4_VITVI|nr:hypothetical protein VitviT2T_008580 [Vitis vinifera]